MRLGLFRAASTGRPTPRTGRSWLTRLGTSTIAFALAVLCVALPFWALTDGNLTDAAGWANILALPATVVGLVLTVVGQRQTRRLRDDEPVPPRRRPWMAPPLDRMIERPDVGTELLRTLTEARPTEVALTTELQGAGGFGKTRLATWVCHRPEINERYPGGLLWTVVGQEVGGADLAVRVNDLIFALTGERSTLADPEAAGAELGRLLDEQPPILLIVDDVWDDAQLRPFRFGGRRTTRLVTTRVPDLLPAGGVRIVVDAMSLRQARTLVVHGVPNVPTDLAERLATLAGRWPVLLNLINGVLRRRVRRKQSPPDAARDIIDQLVRDGPATFDPARSADRSQAVSATVGASLRMLTAEDQQRYLDLGMFPEDVEIPVSVLEALWDGNRVHQLCEDLVGLGLVADYRLDAPEARLVLHDIMRAFLQSRRSAGEWSVAHGRLVDAAAHELHSEEGVTPWWLLPDDARYLWRYLPYHLHRAGRPADLLRVVTDLRWVEEKTRRFGSVAAVQADLDLTDQPVAKLLERHLGRAAALLGPIEPPAALGATLASRLHQVAGLEELLEPYRAGLARPRLEPAWPLPDAVEDQSTQTGHSGGVTGCVFSSDQSLLVTVSDDGTVRIWRVADGSQQNVLLGHAGGIWDCAFSPDSALLATASTDRTVRVWNVTTGETVAVLYGHTDWVRSCAFSPDGTLLASTSADGTVRLWGAADWRPLATLHGHTAEVRNCAFSPDGRLLASASNDGTVRVWRSATGTTVAVLAHQGGPVWDCAFAHDGRLLAAATTGLVRLWRTSDWQQAGVLHGRGDEIDSCAFSPDDAQVAGTSYGMVQVWRPAVGPEPTVLGGHTGAVWACAFSPDGTMLATASNDQTARIWRTSDRTTLRVLAGGPSKVNSCAFSPDGRIVATTDYSGAVLLRDVETGHRTGVLRGHDSRAISCAFSPDGRLLATTSKGDVRLWNVGEGSEYATLTGHTDWVRSCMFSPDGTLLATASADRSVRLWSVLDAQPLARFDDAASGFRSCAFSPDGSWMAAGTAVGAVRLWRPRDGRTATITGHTGGVHSCAFSPDGSLLATVSGDRTVRLWRTADHTLYASLSGHTSWADRCAFSPDGSLLATVSNDQTIRLWEVKTGTCVCALRVGGPLSWVAWHPDGTRLCAVGGVGTYVLRYLP
ncbi:NB-ARC domain-containing protein [Micromonospora sp. NPDC048986]|uniref:WD40 domain-containing protein n=1 Tax=Micromonospora sp. NPDC048986 TaxID=3155644 RepID=UPI0033C5B211